MISKKITLHALLITNAVIINAFEINISEKEYIQAKERTKYSEIERKIQAKHQQSYFSTTPQTYLNIRYKNNYVEVMQHLINSSPEEKSNQ